MYSSERILQYGIPDSIKWKTVNFTIKMCNFTSDVEDKLQEMFFCLHNIVEKKRSREFLRTWFYFKCTVMKKIYSTIFNAKKSFGISIALCVFALSSLNLSAQVSGNVFRDYNATGIKESGSGYNEPNVPGITVKAYNAAGTVLATTTTGANGNYSFTAGQIPAATKVRLEFTGWMSEDYPGAYGTDNKTSVQFVTAPNNTANFAINYPGDYVDAPNARIIVPSYTNGNNQIPGAWPAASGADNTYAFNYGSGAAANIISDMGQIGSVWATAYSRKADKLFYAAFVKRHVSLGPLGMNGIYVTTGAKAITTKTNTGNFVNLNAINPAFDAGSLPGRSFSPGNQFRNQANRDDMTGGNVFDEVGKKGIGGMTISDDGRYLYIINLNDRKLWRVDIGVNGTAPTLASQIVAYNAFPVVAGNSTFRPFAVKFYRGAIYVGGVLDGVKPDNSSVNRSELKAVVLKVSATVTPGSETFTTVLDAPLTYQRRANINTGFGVNKNTNYTDPNGTIAAATLCQGSWHPWARNFSEVVIPPGSDKIIYPQPMLSSLDFDPADGSMILGITDRTGHQAGNQNLGPTSIGNNTLYTSNSAGDILKAANNGTYSSFTLESNGTNGAYTTSGAGNNEGPGGGEFFYTDRYENGVGGALGIGNTANGSNPGTSHEETSTGSIAMFPGKELIATAFDPIDNWFTGGVRYYSSTDGIAKDGKVLYLGASVEYFGKANGLGDLEIISAPAPIEIGNRVWFDANANGVQDADENGIAGVTVQLTSNTPPYSPSLYTVIATAVTDANGNYIFSSDASKTSTGSEKYGIAQFTDPINNFRVQIPNLPGSTTVQAPLVGYDVTLKDNGGADANADERDNDANAWNEFGTNNIAVIYFTTGGIAGANNHSYDFGFATAGSVGGGGGGGVESKSLGDAIALRVYNKAINSIAEKADYSKMPSAERTGNIVSNATGTQLKLTDILPRQLANYNFKSFVSTPKDLIGITNAKDVLSIDFVNENTPKAVAFGTQTQGEVYDHTKAICDRLKGYELVGMQNVTVKGINMVQYNLRNNDGNIEYAMSFIIGAKTGRNSYTIQSNWLNKDYTVDETMYNIQLWGGSPVLATDMAADIITRLTAGLPVNEIKSNAGLPKTYITAGKRVEDNLSLTINNVTSATSGYFEVSDRATENTTVYTKRTVPFTVNGNGKTTIALPTGDLYESTIKLYMNGVIQDEVFMADGSWGVDYNTNTTSVKKFEVKNSTAQLAKDEFHLFRNVDVNATTPDLIGVYKLLRGGGAPQDLSAFKTLKITAAGNSVLTVTLVKQSITNWADQYTYQFSVNKDATDFLIPLTDFKSSGSNKPIDPKDITTMIVALGTTSAGKNANVEVSLSNVSFTKEDIGYIRSLSAKDVTAYPNPSKGTFNLKFKADKDYALTLKVTEAGTGNVIMSQAINATKGENSVPVNLNINKGQKMYIISLDGSNVKYKATKLVMGKD
jgi:hypothetical protein